MAPPLSPSSDDPEEHDSPKPPSLKALPWCVADHREVWRETRRAASTMADDELIEWVGDVQVGFVKQEEAARVRGAALTAELAVRNRAPRWVWPTLTDQSSAIMAVYRSDAPYLDLIWLVTQWPGHRLPTHHPKSPQRWANLWLSGHYLRLGHAVVDRKDHWASKRRALGLETPSSAKYQSDPVMTVGCRDPHIMHTEARKRHKQIQKERPGKRVQVVDNRPHQLTQEQAEVRLLRWEATRLAGKKNNTWRWTDAARIYYWMTGEEVGRQDLRRLIKDQIGP